MSQLNIIRTGVLATVLIIAFTFFYSSLFDAHAYTGWVGFVWMTVVPVQIIFGLLWHFEHPAGLAKLSQPVKGLAYLALSLVPMLIGGAFLYTVAGGSMEPGPFLIMATIMSIVGTFWFIGAWQCWPLSLVIKNPVLLGVGAFIISHALGFAAYRLFFDFGFLSGAPVYSAALDPAGLYFAWNALSYAVTSVAVIMCLSLFAFWPCSLISSKQPVLGISITILVLALTSAIFQAFILDGGMDPVDYLVKGPVAVIFGVFLVTNMMQHQLLASKAQPVRGVILLVLTGILAYGMQMLYRAAIPHLVDGPLREGAPLYEVELWIATALLAITFPVINVVSGYFGFWPLLRGKK